MFSIGQVIGQWRIVRLLGEGGMAYVYEAENLSLQRFEALKVLKPQANADPLLRSRFLDEAVHAARIVHPNVVQIYAVNTINEQQTLMAMQIVRGPDLESLLERRHYLSLPESVSILEQVASALDAAHSNELIHRDVKPANVLLEQRPHGWHAFVVDFGIARAFDQAGSRNTLAGMIVGTPEFMSPEQAEGLPDISYKSDQYSLACVAYRMLSGRSPFETSDHGSGVHTLLAHINKEPPPLTSLVPGISSSVSNAIAKALSKKSDDRFTNCAGFIAALKSDSFAPDPPLPAPPPPQPSPSSSFGMLVSVVTAALLLGTALIAFAITSGSSQNSSGSQNSQQVGQEYSSQVVAGDSPPSPMDVQPTQEQSRPEPPTQDLDGSSGGESDAYYLPAYWGSEAKSGMPKLRLRRLKSIPKQVTTGQEVEVWYSGKVTSAGSLPVRGAVTLEVRGPATIISTNGVPTPKEVAVFDGEGGAEMVPPQHALTEVYRSPWPKDKELILKVTLKVDYTSGGKSIQLLATANASLGKAKHQTLINVTAPDPTSSETTNQQNLPAVPVELSVIE